MVARSPALETKGTLQKGYYSVDPGWGILNAISVKNNYVYWKQEDLAFSLTYYPSEVGIHIENINANFKF